MRAVRATAAVLGVGVWWAARTAFAAGPAPDPPPPAAVPRDGNVAFSYSRAAGVMGCSQQDEAAFRFLLAGVMRVEPFVPAGKSAPLTLVAKVTRERTGVVRATLEMRDASGASKGSTSVDDSTCDGVHTKLLVAIALLLQPQPPSPAVPSSERATPPEGAGAPPQRTAPVDPLAPPPATNGTAAPTATAPLGGTAPPGGTAAPAHAPVAAPEPVCSLPLLGYCLAVDIYAFAFSAGGALSLGYTADPGGGAWLNAEIRPIEEFSLGLEFRGLFPSRVVATGPADPSKPYSTPKEPDLSDATFMLVPCYRYSWLMGCAVGYFGAALAQTPLELIGWPVMGVGPRIGIDVPFAKRFFARVQGDVLFNLTNSSLQLTNVNLEWRQNVAVGYIGAGLGVTLR